MLVRPASGLRTIVLVIGRRLVMGKGGGLIVGGVIVGVAIVVGWGTEVVSWGVPECIRLGEVLVFEGCEGQACLRRGERDLGGRVA